MDYFHVRKILYYEYVRINGKPLLLLFLTESPPPPKKNVFLDFSPSTLEMWPLNRNISYRFLGWIACCSGRKRGFRSINRSLV